MTKSKLFVVNKAFTSRNRGFHLLVVLTTILAMSVWVQANPKAANQLTALEVNDSEARTRIQIVGQSEPTFTVFRLTNPTRVFVDVSNATSAGIPANTAVRNGVLRQINIMPLTDEQTQIVRIVFELEVDALYNVRAQGNRIVVDVDNSERLDRAVVIDADATLEAQSSAEAAQARAEDAERRARIAERRAKETQLALESARERAVENARQAEALRQEAATLRTSQTERLSKANQRANVAERRLDAMEAEIQAKLSVAQRSAEEAFQRADRAETDAARKIARVEADARLEEAKAMKSAVEAAERSDVLEKRALSAEQRAQNAESEVLAVKNRLNSLNAKVSQSASDELVKAKAELQRLKAEASITLAQAEAAREAAEEKSRVYEVRASEATLRAQQAVEQSKDVALTKKQLEETEREAARLAASAKSAEENASAAQTQLKLMSEELASLRATRQSEREAAKMELVQAQKRALIAEQRANEQAADAEARAKRAEEKLSQGLSSTESQIAKAKAEAVRAEASFKRAQARAQSAQTRAAEAENRALEASNKTAEMGRRAEEAQAKLDALSSQLEGVQSAQALNDARSDAALEQAALEKAQLEEKLRRAELEQAQARARIEALIVQQQNLSAQVQRDAKANQAQRANLSQAEKRAQEAELASEKARVAQLETIKRAVQLEQDLSALRAERDALKSNRSEIGTAEKEDALRKASQRISALEAQLSQQQQSEQLSSQRVADSQLKLSEANQVVLLAQTKLAQAEERARAAELKAQKESRRAESAEEAAVANRAEADTAKAAASEARAQAERARADAEAARLQAQEDRQKAVRAEKAQAEAIEKLTVTQQRAADAEAKLEDAKQSAQVEAAPVLPPATLPPPVLPTTQVVNVGFASDETFSSVRVDSSTPLVWTLRGDGLTTQTLVLQNANIAPLLERTLDTSDFGGNVSLVSSFQAPNVAQEVHVVVTLREATAGRVEQEGNAIVWRFPRLQSAESDAYTSLPPPAWQGPTAVMTDDPTRVAPYTGLNQMSSPVENRGPRGKKRYRGRKVNVDIKDGDIHNVLRVLAKTGNVNIVTSDEVSGTVTMHLKLVPWDQALDMVLRTKGLDMVREGDIIRVAPAEMIAQEREAELKKLEVRERLKPLEVKMITVNHANAQELIPRIKSVLSSRGSAEFDTRTNTVIVKDVDDHLDAAEDMVLRLDTQTPQVLIETRIVEVNEVNVKQFGIQWGMDSVWSAATGNPTGLRFPSSVGISGGADDNQTVTAGVSSQPNFVVNLPSAAGAGSGGAIGLTFGSIDSTFNLNVRLSAMENSGSVKIVSSPKITTLDNKVARISQGVSIPISQVSATGVQTVFFDAVLALEVQPHVTQDGNIYLKLKAENNTPDFQNVAARGDPTILKKEAQTELLLRDGDTTVIGGIYTSNAGMNRSEVPFFGSIPILGALFRNHQQSDRRTELLIFVTPRIVNRAAATVRTVR